MSYKIIMPETAVADQDSAVDYPIGCQAQWVAPAMIENKLSVVLYHWLTDTGSLTARLKLQCQHFAVEVLTEGIYPLSKDEQEKLQLAEDRSFVREVLLKLDGVPWVFARSVMPLSTLTGEQACLSQLGNNPLGQILFNAPDMQRSDIEVAEFAAKSPVQKLASQLSSRSCLTLFGRRSRFLLSGKALLVSEIFLPDAAAYD